VAGRHLQGLSFVRGEDVPFCASNKPLELAELMALEIDADISAVVLGFHAPFNYRHLCYTTAVLRELLGGGGADRQRRQAGAFVARTGWPLRLYSQEWRGARVQYPSRLPHACVLSTSTCLLWFVTERGSFSVGVRKSVG
jgi:hypothetical protein